MKRTYANKSWVPLDPGPDDVSDESLFGLVQFTVLEVLNAKLDLDSNEGPDPDGIPPLILKNCASAYALPLCLLLETFVCYSYFKEWEAQ
jgi:hypothetical protein